jgi:hypothetical protein
MAVTPMRSFRISDDLYAATKSAADDEGIAMTEIITGAFKLFVAGRLSVNELRSENKNA